MKWSLWRPGLYETVTVEATLLCPGVYSSVVETSRLLWCSTFLRLLSSNVEKQHEPDQSLWQTLTHCTQLQRHVEAVTKNTLSKTRAEDIHGALKLNKSVRNDNQTVGV